MTVSPMPVASCWSPSRSSPGRCSRCWRRSPGPIAWALTLAFLLAPLQRALARRFGDRAGPAAGLITALTPIVLLLPLTTLGVMFVRQVDTLVERLRNLPPLLQGSPLQQLETLPVVGPGARWLRENLAIGSDELMASATDAAQTALKGLASAGGGVVLGAVGTVSASS
jgi:predicted PurR-regulated permease PerM